MAQLFLYREGAALAPEDLAALREAGLVPIKVADFDDVRIVDPIMAAGSAGAVWSAAVQAIHQANDKQGPKTLFGTLLAERLANATVFGDDGVPLGA